MLTMITQEQLDQFVRIANYHGEEIPRTVKEILEPPIGFDDFLILLGHKIMAEGVIPSYALKREDMPYSFLWTSLGTDSRLVEFLKLNNVGVGRSRENGELVEVFITPSPRIMGLALTEGLKHR